MKTYTFLKAVVISLLFLGGALMVVAAGGDRNASATAPAVSAAANEVITLTLPGGVPLVMVRIPAGTYLMGSTEAPGSPWNTCEWGGTPCDQPVHTVTIGYDFYIGKYEVTQAQWQAVMGDNPTGQTNCSDCPVWNVSWDDTHDFINELNKLGIGVFRLPSEAEWQYAARAGTTTRFYFGNGDSCTPVDVYECDLPEDPCPELSQHAWWGYSTGPGFARPVGQKLPNPWGLYDIYGNVYEWVEDDWLYPFDAYGGAPTDGSPWLYGPPKDQYKVTLGSWRGYCDPARYRSGYRTEHPRDMRHNSIGLRLVMESLTLRGAPGDRAIYLTWKVGATLPVTTTWRIGYDGPVGDQPSPITGIISPTRAYTLTGLTNYQWYTITLNAMLDSTPFLTDTVRVRPMDRFVYLPVVLK